MAVYFGLAIGLFVGVFAGICLIAIFSLDMEVEPMEGKGDDQ